MKISFEFEQSLDTEPVYLRDGNGFAKYALTGIANDDRRITTECSDLKIHLTNTMEEIRLRLVAEFGDESVPGFRTHVSRVDSYVTSCNLNQRLAIGIWLRVTSEFDGTGWHALPVEGEAVQRIVAQVRDSLHARLSFMKTLELASRVSK
ncbi:MAG: hypothetical protein WA972_18250 [Rhodococcus qingshengii]|jgi:hypothetical protein